MRAGSSAAAGRERFVQAGRPAPQRFPEAETVSMSAQVEKRFMEWMLRDNASPGTTINELELARQFGVATTGIREFLNRFQRFGLIEKRPNCRLGVQGLHAELRARAVRDPRDVRAAIGAGVRGAAGRLRRCGSDSRRCARSIVALLSEIERRFHDFSDLDSRFHRLINSAAPNRFIDSFYDIITLIFHYHYQWNKHDERQRNEVAIREHLTYIEALLSRSRTIVRTGMPRAPRVGERDTDEFNVGEERANGSGARCGAIGKLRIDAHEKGRGSLRGLFCS